jgi:hypothetical protein
MRPGKRLITCPETHDTAAVDIDLFQRMSDCSRWPERADCDRACFSQIHDAPHDCLVQKIVAEWYAGKRCAICERAIGPIVWHERPPALWAPDGTTREWTAVAAEELPRIFATHAPLCWTCHVTTAFRREHAELVLERPRPIAARATLQPTNAVY